MVGYATNAVATSLSFSNWMAHQHPTSLFSLLLLETVAPFSFPRSAVYWCAFKPAGNSFPAPLVSSAYYPLSPIGSWLPNLCLQLWPHHRTLDSNIQTHKKNVLTKISINHSECWLSQTERRTPPQAESSPVFPTFPPFSSSWKSRHHSGFLPSPHPSIYKLSVNPWHSFRYGPELCLSCIIFV